MPVDLTTVPVVPVAVPANCSMPPWLSIAALAAEDAPMKDSRLLAPLVIVALPALDFAAKTTAAPLLLIVALAPTAPSRNCSELRSGSCQPAPNSAIFARGGRRVLREGQRVAAPARRPCRRCKSLEPAPPPAEKTSVVSVSTCRTSPLPKRAGGKGRDAGAAAQRRYRPRSCWSLESSSVPPLPVTSSAPLPLTGRRQTS
ncbi:hypothetical protein [Variovorax sp. UC122_21]|uniref:hypothetical protein n=1 Tax=Variovorax sp. UC122_21 TaxID=3374554 RepID=UPI0037564E5D